MLTLEGDDDDLLEEGDLGHQQRGLTRLLTGRADAFHDAGYDKSCGLRSFSPERLAYSTSGLLAIVNKSISILWLRLEIGGIILFDGKFRTMLSRPIFMANVVLRNNKINFVGVG